MILTIQREGTKDTELTINLLKVQNKFEMKSGLKLSSLYLLSKRRVRLKKLNSILYLLRFLYLVTHCLFCDSRYNLHVDFRLTALEYIRLENKQHNVKDLLDVTQLSTF